MLHVIWVVHNGLHAVYVACYTYDVLCILHVTCTVCYMLCIKVLHITPMCVACYIHVLCLHTWYIKHCASSTLYVTCCGACYTCYTPHVFHATPRRHWPVQSSPQEEVSVGGQAAPFPALSSMCPSCSCCTGSQASPEPLWGQPILLAGPGTHMAAMRTFVLFYVCVILMYIISLPTLL